MEKMEIITTETMTSLIIAEVTGKNHRDVLRAIRSMEPAWEKVNGRKFALVEYKDAKGESRPCYSLTKVECLYIATKFNDEARAKLVLRWEQLERMNAPKVPQSFAQALMLAAQQQEQIEQQQQELADQRVKMLEMASAITTMQKKVTYMDKIFACTSTVKTTTIAQDYGMSSRAFNKLLHTQGVQYRCGDVWVLYAKYLSEGYVKDVPFEYTRTNGSTGVKCNMQWTQKGRAFLYEFLKERNILPLIEQ